MNTNYNLDNTYRNVLDNTYSNILDKTYHNSLDNNLIMSGSNMYFVLDEHMYKTILKNIDINFLLSLFTLSCICSIVFCIKKHKSEYVLISNNDDYVKGEILNKV